MLCTTFKIFLIAFEKILIQSEIIFFTVFKQTLQVLKTLIRVIQDFFIKRTSVKPTVLCKTFVVQIRQSVCVHLYHIHPSPADDLVDKKKV